MNMNKRELKRSLILFIFFFVLFYLLLYIHLPLFLIPFIKSISFANAEHNAIFYYLVFEKNFFFFLTYAIIYSIINACIFSYWMRKKRNEN